MILFFSNYFVAMLVTINLYNCLSDDNLKINFVRLFKEIILFRLKFI